MPALIGLSPRLADQTFPRDDHELRLVSVAIGKLSELVEQGKVKILGTQFFVMLLQDSIWDGKGGFKNQILTHLNLWFLREKAVMVSLKTFDKTYALHPIPQNSRTEHGLEEIWADELGKLLVLHDEKVKGNEYFIGIACENAFAGHKKGQYETNNHQRLFPLVGPKDCDCKENNSALCNAFENPVPENYSLKDVSFETAKRNCGALGGSVAKNPRRGSHHRVKFPRARSWILDPNNDPVPESYLKELEAITGHRLETIIYSLLEGKLPPERLKLSS